MKNANDLLDAMEATPGFKSGPPAANVLAFLARIDDADPNSLDIGEDDSNASWGHQQFTSGNLTCSTVLTSWSAVGSCETASRLIAAALKTCRVARQICFERKINTDTYLSDIYFEKVVDILWDLWKAADGVRNHNLNVYYKLSIGQLFVAHSQRQTESY